MVEAATWDEYIGRVRRYVATGRIDTDELNYKREVARELGGVREAVLSGNANWLDLVREVTPDYVNNLCRWQGRDDLLKWFDRDEHGASGALLKLWEPYERSSPGEAASTGDVIERVRAFAGRMPRDEISGAGTRMRLISFLLMGLDAERYPPFMTTVFADAYELTKYQGPPRDADEAALYEHALGFLDRLIEEADKLDTPRTRLEAQSVVFGMWYPLERFNACAKDLSSAMSKGNQQHAQESLRKMAELLDRLAEHESSDRHREFSDRYRACEREYEEGFGKVGPGPNPQPDLQSLAKELLLDVGALRTIEKLLDDKRQVIFQGPPGTGKTYVARRLAECLAGAPDRVWLVQFHPSYAYEDFVQGIRPTLQGGQAGFVLRNGPLLEAAKAARKKPDVKHFLVIDEINRGNLAKVFGELYFLLEYRGEQMRLQYADAGELFALPGNLYLIGTMNTADRSIALVDLALRRRFHFVEFHPDKPPVRGLLRRWLDEHASGMRWVAEVVDRANAKLDDRQAAIGPSYFMKPDLSKEMVDLIWEHNVLPYIEERFYGEHDRLDEFSLDKLLGETPTRSSRGHEEQNADAIEGADERLRKLLDTPVEALKLSTDKRTSRVKNHLPPDVRTIRDLTRMTAEEIDGIDHIGIKSRKEIESWLSERHLKLGTDYGAVRRNLANGDDGDATT